MKDRKSPPRKQQPEVRQPIDAGSVQDQERPVTPHDEDAPLDDPVDEANRLSFPASDPPAFTPSRAGDASRRKGRSQERGP